MLHAWQNPRRNPDAQGAGQARADEDEESADSALARLCGLLGWLAIVVLVVGGALIAAAIQLFRSLAGS